MVDGPERSENGGYKIVRNERTPFERWISETLGFGVARHSDGEYVSPNTRLAWNAWQARARLTDG